MFGQADGVAVNDNGGDVQKRKLKVGHVDGTEVYVGGRDVELALIVEALAFHLIGQSDDHGPAAHGGFPDRDIALFGNGGLQAVPVGDGGHSAVQQQRNGLLISN